MSRAANRITIRLAGSNDDNGQVRLKDFLAHLELFGKILREADQAISPDGRPTVRYTIVRLSYASPTEVELEAHPIVSERRQIHQGMTSVAPGMAFRVAREITKRQAAPERFDVNALETYRDFAERRAEIHTAEPPAL